MDYLYFRQRISKNSSIKDYCLEHYVLNKIDQHPYVSRSNSHNLLSQLQSVQGASGTLWNRGTYPGALEFNQRGSLGTDGQTIDLLVNRPPPKHPTPVHLIDEKSPSKLLAQLFERKSIYKDNTRAFLDVGAMFAGIPNEQVARDFSSYLFEKRAFFKKPTHGENELPIKYVLFFNEANDLCALPVSSSAEKPEPIILKSTNPIYIAKKLKCSPAECFTYYDQWHTTGIDIRQDVNANAFMTASEKTLKRDFLQGAYRMRGLAAGQTVEVVISSEVAQDVIKKEKPDIQDVIKMTIDNQRNRLAEDHFVSAVQEIQNFVRNDLLSKIIDEQNVDDQHKQLLSCRDVFIQKAMQSATERFGGVKTAPETKDLLEEIAKTAYEKWLQLNIDAGFEVLDKDATLMKTKIDDCVKLSLPKCMKTTRTRGVAKAAPAKQDSTTQAQAQKHRQRETENQTEKQEQPTDPNIWPKGYMGWSQDHLQNPINKWLECMTLNAMAWPDPENERRYSKEPTATASPFQWRFSEAIRVSPNFLETHSGQTGYGIDPDYMTNKKPALFYAIIEDTRGVDRTLGENPQYFALVITPEEAEALKKRGPTTPDSKLKISVRTAHGNFFGCDKFDLKHPHCQTLIEQVEYFNGDAHLLSRQAKTSQWFDQEKPDEIREKIEYLRNSILSSHLEKQKFLPGLEETLSKSNPMLFTKTKPVTGHPEGLDLELKQQRDIPGWS